MELNMSNPIEGMYLNAFALGQNIEQAVSGQLL